MKTTGKTTTIIATTMLALSLSACGSDGGSDASSGDKTTVNAAKPSDMSAPTDPSAAPETPSGAMVSDEKWAGLFKKGIPKLADVPDAEIVKAGKDACATFKADPTTATAKKVLKDLETTFKLNTTQAGILAGGVTSHFCEEQATAFLDAQIGG